MASTWKRIGVRHWQKMGAPESHRRSVVERERLDPCVKCSLWCWAMTRADMSAEDASYMDVLDEDTVNYIMDLAGWSVVKDRKEMGWACICKEFLLLPRCPVHDTVIIFFIFMSPMVDELTAVFFILGLMGAVLWALWPWGASIGYHCS